MQSKFRYWAYGAAGFVTVYTIVAFLVNVGNPTLTVQQSKSDEKRRWNVEVNLSEHGRSRFRKDVIIYPRCVSRLRRLISLPMC